MKEFFYKNHHKIDVFAVTLFLYSVFLCFFVILYRCLNFEAEYIIAVLFFPVYLINKKLINKINTCLHVIFGFRR